MTLARDLAEISKRLSVRLRSIRIDEPVTHVYDPTHYAIAAHEAYLACAQQGVDALMLGMNPGPWGMAQTGVPFGEVAAVRDYLEIDETVGKPRKEHPKRPVLGLECVRSEVSGRRLWDWVSSSFQSPAHFFSHFFIWNWCPLAFMEESGRNRTPDKLPLATRRELEAACDDALREIVDVIQPRAIIGVGAFARKRAQAAMVGRDVPIHQILHPSPASPAANRGWQEQIERQLGEIGLPRPVAVRCLDSEIRFTAS